jgi:hypothetical protein
MLDKDVIIQYHQQGIGYLWPLPTNKEYEEVRIWGLGGIPWEWFIPSSEMVVSGSK